LIGQFPAIRGRVAVADQSIGLPLPTEGGVRFMQNLRVWFVPEDRKE